MTYAPTTKITRQDLQVFPSERLTDNDDGGGMPTGAGLTGADNELFDPIAAIAWLNGGFYARSVFMGVRRADDEPLLGAYAAITVPPKNGNVSYLMFPATKFGEYRHEILKRIESYVVGSIESRMTLLGTQSKYSKIIQAYQRVGEPLPLAGDVYELRQNRAGYKTASQFVKIIRVEAEERTFTRNDSDFKRMVLSLEITTKLEEDFVGIDYPVNGYANAVCQIRETNVADAANYYGVKPIVQPIVANSDSIKVNGIFEKIIPTNEISIPLKDKSIDKSQTLFDSAKAGNDGVVSLAINANNSDVTNLHLPNACVPNTLRITTNSGEITDDGGNLVKSNEVIGSINYVNKLLTLTSNAGFYMYSLTFRPATGIQKISDTAKIDVTLNNRSTEYAVLIDPPPPIGSVSASYRAQGTWYNLKDQGNGRLRGVSEQHGSGTASNTTGTVSISAGALPDVGSSIIFNWGSNTQYFNRSGQATNAYLLLQLADNADPSSIALSWNDGTAKTATCDATGAITGNWTGTFDQATNQIRINTGANFNHPAGALDVTVSYNKGEKKNKQFPSPLRGADGKITLDLGDTPIKPNTFKMKWNLLIENYDSPITTETVTVPNRNWVDPYQYVRDNGSGKLVDVKGKEYGTIDYNARTLTFNPDTTVLIPKSKYKNVALGSESINNGATITIKTKRRVLFDEYEYIPAGASMPIDESGLVEVWFYDTSATSAVTENLKSNTIEIDLLANYSEVIAPKSTLFAWGAKTYFERNGRLYTDLNVKNGNANLAGTLDKETGKATLTSWQWTNGNAPDIKSLATSITGNPIDAVTFRTQKAPINQGMIVRAVSLDGALLTAVANANGEFNANNIIGKVDTQFGVVDLKFGSTVVASGNESQPWYSADAVDADGNIFKPRHVFASTIQYTAFAVSYLPINSDIVKIDTVRLPQDGRVPIFRAGDSILISNIKTDALGSAFQSGQTVNLSRKDIDRICLKDADNKPINAQMWTYDLDEGTVTFATPLDLSTYKMPITAQHTREERNRVLSLDIDGTIKLLQPTKRAYDIADTYVSSLLIGGNLQVRHSIPFTQRSWDGIYRDEPNGQQTLTKLNLTDYPMLLTDLGAISQRWVIKYKTSDQFELYGERLGFVGTFDMLTDLAPINPWTKVPYFVIPKEAFGNKAPWESQNIIAFETWGTLMPVWILCAAQPTNNPQQGTDGFKYCFYGDTTEI